MPQQGRRKAPFSKKIWKANMKAKKEKKKLIASLPEDDLNSKREIRHMSEAQVEKLQNAVKDNQAPGGVNFVEEIEAINQQPRGKGNANRYNLKFKKATIEERKARMAAHYVAVELLPRTALEAGTELFFPAGLGYPNRPSWDRHMTKEQLDIRENRHFRLFCENLERQFNDRELSRYELNLETWRQLWRVTEMSDIILIIVDVRFPVAQFPPYLYEHLVKCEKGVILVMNKCDLVPAQVVTAWQHYFQTHYPKLTHIPFSSLVGHCPMRLVDVCRKIVGEAVDLQSWGEKVEEDMNLPKEALSQPEVEEETVEDETAPSTQPEHYQRFRDGVLTIGTVGYPNVGKSSFINALVGKKVVSVSKTPGHTKHFQTIFLTNTVKLCDCPGLVFPSSLSTSLQVLSGSYPIAQVRDPMSVVRYIASRLDLPTTLRLKHEMVSDEGEEWTPYYICEAWAEKRGYYTRKGGFRDVGRAANELLRLCFAGQKSLTLYLRPPGYTAERAELETDALSEGIVGLPAHFDDQTDDDTDEEELCDEDVSMSDSEDEESDDAPAPSNRFALLADDV